MNLKENKRKQTSFNFFYDFEIRDAVPKSVLSSMFQVDNFLNCQECPAPQTICHLDLTEAGRGLFGTMISATMAAASSRRQEELLKVTSLHLFHFMSSGSLPSKSNLIKFNFFSLQSHNF